MKPLNIAVVMDPIESIKTWKDSSFAMMLEAQKRQHQLFYLRQENLFMDNAISYGTGCPITLQDLKTGYYSQGQTETRALQDFDVILMRKDPPFDMEYIYTTYLLQQAEEQGTLVVNKPASLRDCNEKLFTREFPQCCPATRITRDAALILDFLETHQDIIIKPLNGMGGRSIFRMRRGDSNNNAIIEAVTEYGQIQTMVQQFIPEIQQGDKRILLIQGKPIDYALVRTPAADDHRGNLAAGATSHGQPLTDRDYWICNQLGPKLVEKGLIFVGIDVIGDYLTEINVTSPTCIRELDQQFNLNISATLFDEIEQLV